MKQKILLGLLLTFLICIGFLSALYIAIEPAVSPKKETHIPISVYVPVADEEVTYQPEGAAVAEYKPAKKKSKKSSGVPIIPKPIVPLESPPAVDAPEQDISDESAQMSLPENTQTRFKAVVFSKMTSSVQRFFQNQGTEARIDAVPDRNQSLFIELPKNARVRSASLEVSAE